MLFRKPHVPVWKKCRKARHAAPVEERELMNTSERRLRRRVMDNEEGKITCRKTISPEAKQNNAPRRVGPPVST